MDVLVAGGGIAGLSVALTCHQVGISVQVAEAAREVRPLGLGINLQPSAVRELHELGLRSELAAIAVPTDEFALARSDGVGVVTEPRGTRAGTRWPQLSVRRGDLEMMLFRAAVDRLGADAIRTGRRVAGYEHEVGCVHALVDSADGATERVEAVVLVAADGMHSAVRARMFPGEGGPRWGGAVLWRGVAPGPQIRDGASFVVIGDERQRFTTFPISARDPQSGLQQHNWIAQLAFDPHRGWRRGDWNTQVASDDFVAPFEDWVFEWLDVPALIRGADAVFEYPMVDRDPAGHWVHGSVVLVGDAAHPMYPVGSNGASQAIVDARVLGAAFLEHGVGREALAAYQERRHGPMSTAVLRNRLAGPFSVLGSVDAQCAEAFDRIGPETTPSELRECLARYESSAAAAVRELNEAPPIIPPGARVAGR
jgi:2-polyprenyl-6-methoxyphenol hydroxylase-like FAD-dependent oxidoreductase